MNYAKTRCGKGHEFTPENTYNYRTKVGKPHRECRRCAIDRAMARKKRLKEAK